MVQWCSLPSLTPSATATPRRLPYHSASRTHNNTTDTHTNSVDSHSVRSVVAGRFRHTRLGDWTAAGGGGGGVVAAARIKKSRSDSSLASWSDCNTVDEPSALEQQRFTVALSRLPQPRLRLKRRSLDRQSGERGCTSLDHHQQQQQNMPSTSQQSANSVLSSEEVDGFMKESVCVVGGNSNNGLTATADEKQLMTAAAAAAAATAQHWEEYDHFSDDHQRGCRSASHYTPSHHPSATAAASVMSLSCISERSECSSIGSFQIAGSVGSTMLQSSTQLPQLPLDSSLMFTSTMSTTSTADTGVGTELLNNVQPPSLMHSIVSLQERSPPQERKHTAPQTLFSNSRHQHQSNTTPVTTAVGGGRNVDTKDPLSLTSTMDGSLMLLDSMSDSVYNLERVKPPAVMEEVEDMENSLFNLDSIHSETEMNSTTITFSNSTLQPTSVHSHDTDHTMEPSTELVESDTDLCATEELPADQSNQSSSWDLARPAAARDAWLRSCTTSDPITVAQDSGSAATWSHELGSTNDSSEQLTITISDLDTTATETLCHSCSSKISKKFSENGHGPIQTDLVGKVGRDSEERHYETYKVSDTRKFPAKSKEFHEASASNFAIEKSHSNSESLDNTNIENYHEKEANLKIESSEKLSEQAHNGKLAEKSKLKREPYKLTRNKSALSCTTSAQNAEKRSNDSISSKTPLYSAPWRTGTGREVRHVSPARRPTAVALRARERPKSALEDRTTASATVRSSVTVTVRETRTSQLRRASTELLGGCGGTNTPAAATATARDRCTESSPTDRTSVLLPHRLRRTSNQAGHIRRPLSADVGAWNRGGGGGGLVPVTHTSRTVTRHHTTAKSGSSAESLPSSDRRPPPPPPPAAAAAAAAVGASGGGCVTKQPSFAAAHGSSNTPVIVRQRTFTLDDSPSADQPPAEQYQPPVTARARPSLPPRPFASTNTTTAITRTPSAAKQTSQPARRRQHAFRHEATAAAAAAVEPRPYALDRSRTAAMPKSVSCDSGLRTAVSQTIPTTNNDDDDDDGGGSSSNSTSGDPDVGCEIQLRRSGYSSAASVGVSVTGNSRPVNVMAVIQPYNYRPPDRRSAAPARNSTGKIIDVARIAAKRRSNIT